MCADVPQKTGASVMQLTRLNYIKRTL